MNSHPTEDNSKAVFDDYLARSWRAQSERQRARGLEFVIGRREGPYLWNLEGTRRLIDCAVGGGVHSLGHRNPEILSALKAALDGPHDAGLWSFPNRPYVQLQERLAALAPAEHLERSVITLSSTASIDLAVMCAFRATGRHKVLAYEHGYHGHSGFAALATGSHEEGVIAHYGLPREHSAFVSTFGDLDAMNSALTAEIAAVIIEPMDYETFAPASPEFLLGLARLCRERGALFILDETRTGLGRSGKLWAAEHSGVSPDIMITGKGLSGGLYPVSAVLMSTDLYDLCVNSHRFAYISSLGGNEIGCCVAHKVLDVASRADTLQNVCKVSEHLTRRLAELCSRYSGFIAPGTTFGGILTVRARYPGRALSLQRAVHEAGLLCHSVSTINPSVLKLLPVLTIDTGVADEIGAALEVGVESWVRAAFA